MRYPVPPHTFIASYANLFISSVNKKVLVPIIKLILNFVENIF